jgi:hypothetical protein
LKKPILARHAQTVREETEWAAHNARVLDLKKPFTEAEKAEAAFVKERGPAAARDILACSTEVAAAPEEISSPAPDAGDALLKLLSGNQP